MPCSGSRCEAQQCHLKLSFDGDEPPTLAAQELGQDGVTNDELVCPEATAGLWSTITFSWVSDLMKKGYKCGAVAAAPRMQAHTQRAA